MRLNFYLEDYLTNHKGKKKRFLQKLTVFNLIMLTSFLLIFSEQIDPLIKSTLMTPGEGFLLENLGRGVGYICYPVVEKILSPLYFKPIDITDPFRMCDV